MSAICNESVTSEATPLDQQEPVELSNSQVLSFMKQALLSSIDTDDTLAIKTLLDDSKIDPNFYVDAIKSSFPLLYAVSKSR
jgi:hypothetical protein